MYSFSFPNSYASIVHQLRDTCVYSQLLNQESQIEIKSIHQVVHLE